jgi:hypothetical protein
MLRCAQHDMRGVWRLFRHALSLALRSYVSHTFAEVLEE